MSTHPDIELVTRYYEHMNDRALERYDDTHHPDVALWSVGGVEAAGIDAVRAFDSVWLTASSDFHVEGLFHLAGDGRVVCHNRALGTHDGVLRLPDGTEVAATGVTIGGPYFASFEVRDGKIASESVYFDRMLIAEQVGLVPVPA